LGLKIKGIRIFLLFLHFLSRAFSSFTMDSNDDLELNSDSRADIKPLSDSKTESEESRVPKGQGNSIGARIQALTLFKPQVPHEKITA
jgi:hypothetical protein